MSTAGPQARSRSGAYRWALFSTVAVLLLGPPVALIVHRLGQTDQASGSADPRASGGPGMSDHSDLERLLASSEQLIRQRRAEESLAPLRRALAIAPRSAQAYNNFCVAYGLLGSRAEAIAACRRALQLEPRFERAANNLRWVESLPSGGSR